MQCFEINIKTPLSHNAVLDCYIQNNEKCQQDRKRPAIIICPGGGYEMIADREGEPIAIKMLSFGFQAFVLNYSLTPIHFPVSLTELSSSVQYVREHAEQFNIAKDAIFVGGFSAGGHLAASLGVYWNSRLLKQYGYETRTIEPNALLLGYPVITSGKYTHKNSIINLIGKEEIEDKQKIKQVSLEKHVNKKTPPSFIWHTVTDDVVPVQNSLLFANALAQNHINFELCIYPQGGHGLSLGTKETAHKSGNDIVDSVTNWPDRFAKFAIQIGHTFLNEK